MDGEKMVSESKKIILAKWFFRNPDRFTEEANMLGISKSDISGYIENERKRIDSITGKTEPKGYTYYMGGKPYWSPNPRPNIWILVDGDNVSNEDWEQINFLGKWRLQFLTIHIYACQEERINKFEDKLSHVQFVYVEEGEQAVDKEIKSDIDRNVERYNHIVIVSKDKGYDKDIPKLDHGNSITRCEDISELKAKLGACICK